MEKTNTSNPESNEDSPAPTGGDSTSGPSVDSEASDSEPSPVSEDTTDSKKVTVSKNVTVTKDTAAPKDTAASKDTADVEDATDDAVAEDGADGTGKPAPWWLGVLRWLRRPATAVLVLVAVVAIVLAAVFGLKLRNRDADDDSAQEALAAAQQYALVLTSIDATHIDDNFASVMNGATGEFKKLYSQSADQLKPLLVQANSVSKGRVVAASIQSASDSEVVVMLFVDSEITNSTNPTPRIDRNRILMTMSREDDRWLASKVDLP